MIDCEELKKGMQTKSINRQLYVLFHFSKNVFVCYFCPFCQRSYFFHNNNVMTLTGSEK